MRGTYAVFNLANYPSAFAWIWDQLSGVLEDIVFGVVVLRVFAGGRRLSGLKRQISNLLSPGCAGSSPDLVG
jgi:hypothetical protein